MTKLEELLDSLPAYLHDDEEPQKLYLFISRDITGDWMAAYFTHAEDFGRYYHPQTGKSLTEVITALCNELKHQEKGIS